MDIEKVIFYFKKVCSIPRASGDEKAISDYIADFARERGLEAVQDSHYNIIIRKPATVPHAGEPVILQGHLDMVYVKENDSGHVYADGIEVNTFMRTELLLGLIMALQSRIAWLFSTVMISRIPIWKSCLLYRKK